jgi:hypothetical protein
LPTQSFVFLIDGLRRDEERLGAAVLEDELPLLVELRLVHRDPHGPERVGRVGADGPLDAVVRDARDLVAATDAARSKPRAERVDESTELAVRHPAPDVADLRAEELTTGELFDGGLEKLDEVLEFLRAHSSEPTRSGGERHRSARS